MIYAAEILKTDSSITIGGYSNHPLCRVLGFKDQAAFDAKQDELWKDTDRFTGYNLVKVNRRWVEKYFGTRFQAASDGQICQPQASITTKRSWRDSKKRNAFTKSNLMLQSTSMLLS